MVASVLVTLETTGGFPHCLGVSEAVSDEPRGLGVLCESLGSPPCTPELVEH